MAKKPVKPEAQTPATSGSTTIGGKTYARKSVTLPAIKLEEGKPTVLRVTSAIRTGKVLKDRKDKDGNVMKPANVMDVTLINADGTDGMQGVVVCGKAIEETLHGQYPNDSYVGKTFEFTVGGKKDLAGGRTFRPVSIVELVAS